ncbi:MAG TPA: thiamine phosphate synthase, partial [Thermoplasmata archaeon]|nr:thiamine phosphate synthase [Thermoplasmata archaeon]
MSAAIAGGASLVQFREKETRGEDRFAAGRVVAEVCRNRDVPFLVNDDADLARRLGADGVHVGRGDTPLERARSLLGPDAIVGATVYGAEGEERAAADAGADYLAAGPFFPSRTKPEEPVMPLHVLDEILRRSPLPVFAIGGITAERAGQLAAHGVA